MDEVLEQLRSIIAVVVNRTPTTRRVAEIIRDARGYRWVGLYDVRASEIVAVGWTGAIAPAFPRFPIGHGLNGAAVRAAQPIVVQDVSTDPRYLTTFGSTGAEAIFPVSRHQQARSSVRSTPKVTARMRSRQMTMPSSLSARGSCCLSGSILSPDGDRPNEA